MQVEQLLHHNDELNYLAVVGYPSVGSGARLSVVPVISFSSTHLSLILFTSQ